MAKPSVNIDLSKEEINHRGHGGHRGRERSRNQKHGDTKKSAYAGFDRAGIWTLSAQTPGRMATTIPLRRNPVGVVGVGRFSQGSSFLATLGFGTESRW